MTIDNIKEALISGSYARLREVHEFLEKQQADIGEHYISSLSGDPNPEVRSSVLSCASLLNLKGVCSIVQKLLSDDDAYVRCAACHAILMLGCKVDTSLICQMLLNDPNDPVRSYCAAALSVVGSRADLPSLELALSREAAVDHEGEPIRNAIQKAIGLIQSRG